MFDAPFCLLVMYTVFVVMFMFYVWEDKDE